MADVVRKIMLVDDEERVLNALARRLRTLRPDWEVVTVPDATKALEQMEGNTPDLVVSDLQMPIMDGATFLAKVRDKFPRVLRFALSGHAQQALMLQAISLSHQYFSKPCDTEKLVAAIEEVLTSTQTMHEERLKEIVVRLNHFPPFPAVYYQLLEVLEGRNKSVEAVCAVIENDPAITAKVLQVANSSFWGSSRQVCELHEAVSRMGFESLRTLVLVFKFLDGMPEIDASGLSQETLWIHSIRVGAVATAIADDVLKLPQLKGELKTIALLHDLGKLVLAYFSPERYVLTSERSQKEKIPLWQVEREDFDLSHQEVGSLLFELWGLPESIVKVIRYHHEPSLVKSADRALLMAIHLADYLSYSNNTTPGPFHGGLDTAFMQSMGLPGNEEYWQEWLKNNPEI